MSYWKKSLFSIILVVGIFLTACGGADGEKETIIFADEGWDSLRFHNEVAGIILDAGYGYSSEQISGSDTALWQGLQDGEIDVHMEGWTANLGVIYTEAIESEEVEEVAVNYDDNYQGLYVPTYVIEGDAERGIEPMAPDLQYITDLSEYQDVFEDPDEPSKGRIIGAESGWVVDELLEEAIIGYGLDEQFNYMSAGSEGAINASLVSAYENGEPWLGYNYEPNWIMGMYDMTPLEEEDPNGIISEIESQDITIAVNVGLNETAPEIVEFLEQYNTSSDIASDALTYIQEEEASAYDAAVKFLQENEDVWTEWVPEDVAEDVRASLD